MTVRTTIILIIYRILNEWLLHQSGLTTVKHDLIRKLMHGTEQQKHTRIRTNSSEKI